MRLLVILGTRPEAIKLAPVIRAAAARRDIRPALCLTGQHRDLVAPVLALFDLAADHDLALGEESQSPAGFASRALAALSPIFAAETPERILVQGDTTSAFVAALAGFYADIPVAHIEAGLRSGSRQHPYPEEMHRRLISALADLHFAPTSAAAANLAREGIAPERISITGNTAIDALAYTRERLAHDPARAERIARRFAFLDPRRRLVLVTGHRRESLPEGLAEMCRGLAELARREDVEILFALHPNPAACRTAREALDDLPRVHLLPPLDYPEFVHLLDRAHLLVTDSGGLQEEAPAFGKPVLVAREATERTEAIEAGAARLVGRHAGRLVAAATELLDDPRAYTKMARIRHLYGDGQAARRIVSRLVHERQAKDRATTAPETPSHQSRASEICATSMLPPRNPPSQ